MELGENVSLDFDLNFEDLEFITEGEETVDDKKTKEGDKRSEGEAGENKPKGKDAGGSEKTTEETKETTKDNEGAAEKPTSKVSERVGGDATDGKSDKESSPQLYHTLAEVLKEQGVFSSVDESSLKDVNDVKTLVDVIKKQIEAEEFKDLTDAQKTVLADMRAGVEPTTAGKYKKAMDKLESITDEVITENKQARFDLIYQDFLSRGFSEDKANKYANRSFELKEDLQDAKEAKDSLRRNVTAQYDKLKEADLNKAAVERAKLEKSKEDLKDRILKTPEVMEGVEVNEGLRHEIYDLMNNMVATNPETGVPENALTKHQREDPIDYNYKLYYLYKVTNGFKDLGYFGRKVETSSTKKLEQALRQSTHVSGGGQSSFSDDVNASLLDIGDLVLPE
jgi:hypothetical protein